MNFFYYFYFHLLFFSRQTFFYAFIKNILIIRLWLTLSIEFLFSNKNVVEKIINHNIFQPLFSVSLLCACVCVFEIRKSDFFKFSSFEPSKQFKLVFCHGVIKMNIEKKEIKMYICKRKENNNNSNKNNMRRKKHKKIYLFIDTASFRVNNFIYYHRCPIVPMNKILEEIFFWLYQLNTRCVWRGKNNRWYWWNLNLYSFTPKL
jgi:hypothetical protein